MQLDGTTPLWIAARGLLNERGEELFRRRDKVLKTFDPEDIHDLRVASRRLREGLALFAPCYPPGGLDPVVKKTRNITRFLGEMRNTDEAILFFTHLADELKDPCRRELDPLLVALQKDRKREERGLRNGLRRIAAGGLRDLYRRAINSPSLFTPPGNGIDLLAPLSVFAGASISARHSAILELLPQARREGAIEAQHRLRIAIKHFRYRMEILSFLLGTGYQQLHGSAKQYQDVLGKMHDLDVFAGIVRETGFSPPAEGVILDALAAKREGLFRDFSAMLERMPLERIGEQLRGAL